MCGFKRSRMACSKQGAMKEMGRTSGGPNRVQKDAEKRGSHNEPCARTGRSPQRRSSAGQGAIRWELMGTKRCYERLDGDR